MSKVITNGHKRKVIRSKYEYPPCDYVKYRGIWYDLSNCKNTIIPGWDCCWFGGTGNEVVAAYPVDADGMVIPGYIIMGTCVGN